LLWLFVKVTFCCLKWLNFVVCCFSWTCFVLNTLIGFLSKKIMFMYLGLIQIVECFCDEMRDTNRWNNFGFSRASHFLLICTPLLFHSRAIASPLRCDVTCYIKHFVYIHFFAFFFPCCFDLVSLSFLFLVL